MTQLYLPCTLATDTIPKTHFQVLNFPDPGAFDSSIVVLDQVSFGYTSGNTLLKDVDLTIDMKSRVALLGRNGCGTCRLMRRVSIPMYD